MQIHLVLEVHNTWYTQKKRKSYSKIIHINHINYSPAKMINVLYINLLLCNHERILTFWQIVQ